MLTLLLWATAATAAPPPRPTAAEQIYRCIGASAFFAPGSDRIDEHSAHELDRIPPMLANYWTPGRIVLEGRVDAVPPGRAGRALAGRRAIAVRRYLIAHGVPAGRVSVATPRQPPAAADDPLRNMVDVMMEMQRTDWDRLYPGLAC